MKAFFFTGQLRRLCLPQVKIVKDTEAMNGQPVVQLQAEQGQVPTHLQKLAGQREEGILFLRQHF